MAQARRRRRSRAALSRSLISHSDDAIAIQPIYSRRVGPRALRAARSHGASSRASIIPIAAAANAQALDDLANGADGLEIIFAGAGGAYGYGLADHAAASLDALFDGVRFDVGHDAATRSGAGG